MKRKRKINLAYVLYVVFFSCRGGGFISLENLLFFGRNYPVHYAFNHSALDYRNVNAYQALEVLKLLGLEFVLEKKNQQTPQKIIIKP